MPKIRILVVDDSVVVRRLISDALTSDPSLEVVGVAANGKIALSRIPQVNPDAITLDVEMPEMDGLSTLKELRKTYPDLPVIMFSTITERGAVATLEALSAGATDYVTKPANVGSVSAGIQRVRDDLIPRLKHFCGKAREVPRPVIPPPEPPKHHLVQPVLVKSTSFDVVCMGVSTGGPNALATLIKQIPAAFPVPILIVQHMPPIFTKFLAERLTQQGNIPVHEAEPGMTVEPGHAYVAPGDFHMEVRRSAAGVKIHTHQGPPENSCRPAVDVLFRSVAEAYRGRTLGVILTGMGQDGLRGVEQLREAGAHIIAQDESSSVVWGMPGAIVHRGLADKVLPLDLIGSEIARKLSAR